MSTPPDDGECIRETRELLGSTPRPLQSDFLVSATVVWVDTNGQYHKSKGVNSETCVMASCICAERCAISQIRLSPHRMCCITSVYITSTSTSELITPGLLCREMLSGFSGAAWVRGGGGQDAPLSPPLTLPQDIRIVLFYASGEACKVYSLGEELYPHAPIFHGVARRELPAFASTFAEGMERVDGSEGGALKRCLDAWNSRPGGATGVVDLGLAVGLYGRALALARTPHPSDTAHPLHLAAGVLLAGGKCVCERQLTALEYGCTVDAVTRVSVAMGGGKVEDEEGGGANPPPLLLLLTDQYGICSSPAAEPRSWLSEFGGGHIKEGLLILVHDEAGKLTITTPAQLAPMAPSIF